MIKELTIPIVCSAVMLQAKNKIKLLFEEKGRVCKLCCYSNRRSFGVTNMRRLCGFLVNHKGEP